MGRIPHCKSCARMRPGVDGHCFCPEINARVDPNEKSACNMAMYLKSERPLMRRHCTMDYLSRVNSENARKVRNHRGGRPKLPPELKMEKTVLLRIRESDANAIRRMAADSGIAIVEFVHMTVEKLSSSL